MKSGYEILNDPSDPIEYTWIQKTLISLLIFLTF